MHETYAPGDMKLVEPFDVFMSQDGKVYRYILNDPNFTSLVKIVKVDSETGKIIPIAGVSFKVWDVAAGDWIKQSFNYPTPTTIDVFETSADGTLVMPEPLKSGDYLLYEVQAPYGYTISKDHVPFTIHSSQTDPTIIEVRMPNKPVKGIITAEKQGNMLTGVEMVETAFGTQYIPVYSLTGLQGAVFNIIAAEDIYTPDGTLRYTKGTVVDTVTTGTNGKAVSKPLYLGNYILIEVTAPYGFVLDEAPHPVSLIYEGQEVEVVSSQIGANNTRQIVELELQKLMEKPVNAPNDFSTFQDVIFGLFANEDITDKDGNTVIPKDSLISLITVDESGKGKVSDELPFAKYYIRELQTNIYYNLNETQYPVNVEYQGQDIAIAHIQINNGGIAIPNELKMGQIAIEKQGEMLVGAIEQDGVYTPIYEIHGLSGVIFDIIAAEDIYDVYGRLLHKKGDVVDTVTTDTDGKATSKLLHLGGYELLEVSVPYGFIPNTEPYSVTLGFDGQLTEIITKTVTIYNERQKAEIDLTKSCEIPENAPDGYSPYADVLFGLYAKADIKTADGETVIPANSLIEVFGIDGNGNGIIQTDLPFGSYYVKELQTATGYKLSKRAYCFAFEYNADNGGTVQIHINNSKAINNKLQRGSLRIIKTFEGRETPIAGVPFTITGTTIVGTTVVINAVTDTNGEIFLDNLLAGNYTVKELESELTQGYVLSPEEAAVVAADEIAEMTINNMLQRGSLKIIKTFEGKETPIAGVKFTISGVSIAGIEYYGEFETDENGEILIEGLPIGEYTVLELESELTEGYILSEKETVPVAANEIAEMTIENKLVRGNVRLIKSDKDSGECLAGAVFELYDPDNNMLGSYTTDENGVIFIENLPYGTGYRFVEIKAPEGYTLENVEIFFDITENCVTIELEVVNEKTPEIPSVPKTGGKGNTIWVAVPLIIFTVGAAVWLRLRKKNKK